ncbi:MAG: rubredoxin-like domain-containing protein [Thermodesulfobacteriota bacterium]
MCGYIHEGDRPPYQCPVCGAPRKMFEEIEPEPVR